MAEPALRGVITGASSPAAPADVPADVRPQLGWLKVGDCHVDERYQRDTNSRSSQTLIAKIADRFDWRRFGAVIVTRWPEKAGWAVIDGQHRIAAAGQRGIAEVPGLIYPEATVAEAAEMFAALNRDRVAVTPLHVFHAMLAAGDPAAVAVNRVCLATGVLVARYPKGAHELVPGETMAVSSLQAVRDRHGDAVLTRTLDLLRRAWPDEGGHIRATLIRGLALLVAKAGERMDDARMVRALATNTGAGWCTIASERKEEGGTSTAAMAMAEALAGAGGLRSAMGYRSVGSAGRDTGATLSAPTQRRCAKCWQMFMTQDLNETMCGMCR